VEWRIDVQIGEERMLRFEIADEDIHLELDVVVVEGSDPNIAASE
jgi:hypothetical protein